jgi:hypothetical protein
VQLADNALSWLSSVLINITGFLPNLMIFELFMGNSAFIPALTEFTFGSELFGGIKNENTG